MEQVDGNATVVFLNFGTGLAAGLVRGGQAEHGYSGSIGEIGHLPIDPNGFECPCGQRGCLETVASGGAVAKLWPSANPPMPDLIRKARQGDGHANDVLAMVAHAMGDTIQIVAQAYDPQRIIIGGGMAKTGDALIEVIQAELEPQSRRMPIPDHTRHRIEHQNRSHGPTNRRNRRGARGKTSATAIVNA